MRKLILAAMTAAFAIATPAGAEIFKDYAPSKEVWNVAFVHVKPSKLDEYLLGLRKTWISGCDEQKKVGSAIDCSIFVSETMQNRDFNVMLVIKQPGAGVNDPDQARYEKVQAALKAKLAEDQRDKIVENYDLIRTFFGEQDFRRVEWK